MDVFKQNRYLTFIIILLVVLNLATLAMVWLGRAQRSAPPQKPVEPEREQARLQQILRDELAFNDGQIERYMSLRQKYREEVQRLNDEIRRIKKRMFDEALQDNPKPELSDSLLALTQQKQVEIERLTFRHFLDLKKLCKPEQQNMLKLIIDELFRGKQAGDKGGNPPAPPNDRSQVSPGERPSSSPSDRPTSPPDDRPPPPDNRPSSPPEDRPPRPPGDRPPVPPDDRPPPPHPPGNP
jgi:protein CpxP